MKIPRREFLKSTAALAAVTSLPAGRARAAAGTTAYPYLGRTEDYADFRIIEPGLTITKVESWTQGAYGIVRITTNDGREGWGQLSTFEPDITATVPHSSHLALVTLFSLHFMAAIPNAGPVVEFSIEEDANAGESLYSPALKVVDGKVKIPNGPGWGVKINPAWIEKAAYLKSERPAKA